MTSQSNVHSHTRDAHFEGIDAARWNTWPAQLSRHALQKPESTAIRFQQRSITWRQLHDRVAQLANWLTEQGIGAGDRVAILLGNRPEFLETLYATASLGAIAVPINFRLTGPEVGFILADSGATIIVTETAFETTASASLTNLPGRITVLVAGEGVAGDITGAYDYRKVVTDAGAPELTLGSVAESDAAAIMYTSGTTGNPKGAVLTHANFQAVVVTMIQAWKLFDEHEITMVATPLFHIGGLSSINATFSIGGTIVIAPTAAFDPAATLTLIAEEQVTSTFLVPAQWQSICTTPDVAGKTSTLRTIAWGASPATNELLTAMSEAFPHANITAVFGQTEMAPVTCVLSGDDAIRKAGSVGRPAANVSVRIVDEQMRDVATGEIGEIVYRGPNLMREYWNNPEATEASFEGGWFHSGDLVRRDDEGYIYVVDRKKDMIISGGENVYSAEVENALAWHPGVKEVAVVGRPDPQWGERVVAVVVPTDTGNPPTLDALIELTRGTLASYKRPRDLVVVDELPRNATGKVTKNVLRTHTNLDSDLEIAGGTV
ncbi:long-chain-fatty-acid--CoA ligase [Rhodococcus pyridinivorans]|uniref:long-chain-fatty-acid--CoA ligase n=1 Tax=Rhodococcus pyridinivorans TaxID=103816 RepID=UPI001E47AD76|nr:long-chain-fatty-acid--CoA ligase [Rhodococcus pyridinivorans]MCD5422437.1 long-chain-fatty-acid--CoA ligase [Rhodococcus pyridinivorans]